MQTRKRDALHPHRAAKATKARAGRPVDACLAPTCLRACGRMDMTWGPDSRPAAVSLVFEGLAAGEDLDGGHPDAPSVTPALPTILRALGDRDLSGTWVVGAAVGEAEPLALTMLRNGGHEVAPPPEED